MIALAPIAHTSVNDNAKRDLTLKSLLGEMLERKPLQIDTLESAQLDGGVRYKIRYFIEPGNPALDTPDDLGSAYLFIPTQSEGKKAPAYRGHASG
ncbi:MAG: hypothetical protein K2G35_02750 [Duncaniella sp.]|nr:hypothetical protein [Duncaniella sp.]